jgi:hypothetical protein
MMMSTILAVALGMAPVKEDGRPQLVQVDPQTEQMVGRYSQTIDRRGRTHVRGSDRLGREYELTLDGRGNVDGTVGPWSVSFHVSEAS